MAALENSTVHTKRGILTPKVEFVKPKVWRGEKKYFHTSDFEIELLKLERLLDSLHQKQRGNKDVSMCLGICRSILGRLGWKQKSLKRWQQVRPNKTEIGK